MPFSRKLTVFCWIYSEFPNNLPLDVESFRSSVPISCGLRGIFANLADIRRVAKTCPEDQGFYRSKSPKFSTSLKWMPSTNLNPDSSEALKAAFRRHASGVAVITTNDPNGNPVGFTATSMTSLGSNPALVTFNVSRGASSWPALSVAKYVALHMLGSKNLNLAQKMAADNTKRFLDSDWQRSEFDLPVFDNVTAVLYGKVREFHSVEQNAVFIIEIVSGATGAEDKALLYNQRAYFTTSDESL
jgi:flavin reductase (DIM6/NTAB) family NADH-FMN oxidoreductase RutF